MASRPLSLKPFKIEDFSGGITDYPIGENDLTKFEKAENLTIDEANDLVTRSGSVINDLNAPYIPQDVRVRTIVEVDNLPYLHSGRALYKPTGSGYVDVSSNVLFKDGTTEYTRASFDTWNEKTYAANDLYSYISKIYVDALGETQVKTLGLPDFKLLGAIRLANALKDSLNIHTQNDHTPSDTGSLVTADNAIDMDTLIALVEDLKVNYSSHLIDANSPSSTYHSGTTNGDFSLDDTDKALTLEHCIKSLKEIKLFARNHFADNDAHGSGWGGVFLSSTYEELAPVITGTPGTDNYIYAFFFEYEYNVGDEVVLERGPVQFVEAPNLDGSQDIIISEIQALQNSDETNYDLVNIRIVIGRTLTNGDVIYRLAEIDNGTTTYSDTVLDASLKNNEGIYIEGGKVDDGHPPQAKYLRIAGDVLHLGNVKEEGVIKKNRVRHSKKFNPAACPSDFFTDFQSEVIGIGRRNVYPIIFEKTRCTRLEGGIDDNGRGRYQKREISNRYGCVSHASIVNIQEGVLFAGEDGFYYTDGFSAHPISSKIDKTYAKLIDKENIEGVYDKKNNLVVWACKTDSNLDYNDILFVAHLDYRKPNGKGGYDIPFTTWNGGQEDNGNFSATALGFINQTFLRGDYRGYLLKHVDLYAYDVVLNRLINPSDLTRKAVRYDHITLSFDFNSSDLRKWVSKIVINAKNESSLSLAIQSSNDNSRIFRDLKPVIDEGALVWSDPTLTWGDPVLRWNYSPSISAWRRFLSRGLRCQYKQLRFTNAFKDIDDSTVSGTATIDNYAKEITLDDYPSKTWVFDSEEYFISFEVDNYSEKFRILSVTDGLITVEDDYGKLDNLSGVNWKIQGYKKGELFSLIDYVLHYDFLTTTQDKYMDLET